MPKDENVTAIARFLAEEGKNVRHDQGRE